MHDNCHRLERDVKRKAETEVKWELPGAPRSQCRADAELSREGSNHHKGLFPCPAGTKEHLVRRFQRTFQDYVTLTGFMFSDLIRGREKRIAPWLQVTLPGDVRAGTNSPFESSFRVWPTLPGGHVMVWVELG